MRRVLGSLVVAASVATILPAQAATTFVTVKNGRFNEPVVEIAVGDTVTWVVQENGHTVSASDYRFDFDPNRTLTVGDTRSWTFTEDETVRYICRIHAPAMSGVIIVGEGSPPPPPPPPITGESRRVPTAAYPTIDAALAGIPRDSEIVLDPGTYAPFTIDADELLVRAATPAETTLPGVPVIDGDGIAKNGVRIRGDDVTLRGLEVVEIADDAVLIEGDDAAVEFSVVHSGFLSGVNARGAARIRVSDTEITANPGATGIAFDDPDGALIEDVTIATAKTGIRIRGGNGVVIRNSTIAGTGTGIALRGQLGAPMIGAHVYRNTIKQTVNPIAPLDQQIDPVTGAGIWLDHVWSARVEHNTVSKTLTYGIAVTGIIGASLDASSTGNAVIEAGIAAEAWDGLGTFCTSSEAATDPPTLASTNACGTPRPGIPFPKVAAELLSFAVVGTALRDSL